MKTIPTLYTLTAILLVGLTTLASAQDEEAQRKAREAQRAMMRSPAMQQMQKNGMKQMMNSFWNGDGSNLMAIGLLQQDEFREGIGVSKEQHQKIGDVMSNMMRMHEDPDFKPFQDEMNKLMTETPGGPFGENASEETRQKFFDLQMKMQMTMVEKMANSVSENLTADQLKKVKEFQISMMSEIPIVSPSMFEALDLSDAQKKQLEGIKKELEPEFEKLVDKMADTQWKFSVKLQDELEDQLDGVTDPEEQQKIMQEIVNKIRKSNPELQRESDEMTESGKAFANSLKFRMFDVLTDEQMERLAELVDNPPEYVKKVIAHIRKQMGEDDSQAGGEWKPGPNSWKPGDAIPEEYRQQREERRFPRR